MESEADRSSALARTRDRNSRAPELHQVTVGCGSGLSSAMENTPELKLLAEINVAVVAKAAECYQLEDPHIDPLFWETLYGPHGPDPNDWGMLYWDDDIYDNA